MLEQEWFWGKTKMQSYQPQKIFVEEPVAGLKFTQKILKAFPEVPLKVIEDLRTIKAPRPISPAKRELYLAQHRGEVVKAFPKVKDAFNLGDYVFNPISNCHLECSYCILQSYLANNPALTIFTNLEGIFAAINKKIEKSPEPFLRIGTGELSDSLALDQITGYSRELVPFFAGQSKAFLELKTKSNQINNLLELDHQGQTVVSFSLSPKTIAQAEELKCASLDERLKSASLLQNKGYPVGLHLDPLIYFEGWEGAYKNLIQQISQSLDPRRIAWISLGSLRYDKGLKNEAQRRFLKTKIFSNDFLLGEDGKFRYFKKIRIKLYSQLLKWLKDYSQDFPIYLCMEPTWMWEEVMGFVPQLKDFEAFLGKRLKSLKEAIA